jgi:alpha/beta superfamily hydrolase
VADDITPSDLVLHTADGLRLEAELVLPAAPRGAVVACHPHPLHGGNMRSLVPGELFRHLPAAGIAVLRFNFRGVEGSEGSHGGGVDEALDVEAAIDTLAATVAGVPLVVAAWSFGADVSLKVVDSRLAGWVAIAPPLAIVDPAVMEASSDPRPKLLVVPEHDQFNPPDRAREVTAGWTATEIHVVNGADHFLVGRTDKVAALTREFVAARISG